MLARTLFMIIDINYLVKFLLEFLGKQTKIREKKLSLRESSPFSSSQGIKTRVYTSVFIDLKR